VGESVGLFCVTHGIPVTFLRFHGSNLSPSVFLYSSVGLLFYLCVLSFCEFSALFSVPVVQWLIVLSLCRVLWVFGSQSVFLWFKSVLSLCVL
jgi:hypothetical protein